jgi:GH43 family beta-xylosidase
MLRRFFPVRRPTSAHGHGAWRRLCFESLERRTVLSASGLLGQYFHNTNFTGLAFERTEAVDFPWGTAAPAPGVHADSFSVRWIGQVEAEFSETYAFRTISDGGARLWVDGQLLIDAWTMHSARVDEGSIALQAGQRYDVRLEYFDEAGSAQIRLQWSSASQSLESIPATHLDVPSEGLRGEYTDNAAGAAERVDAALDFVWPAAPASGVAADNFQASWTGYVRGGYSDQYTYRATSDEGVRVWVGDQLVIDHWTPHPVETATGSIALEAGKWFDVRIEYFDQTGAAELRLEWSSDRQTGAGQFEIVPSEFLRAGERAPLYFTNPLGPGADPFVIRWQDSYLHVRSTGGSVYIDQADLLQDIHRDDPNSVSVRAWTPPPGTNYSTMIWAPELHQINGKWYIYVAAAANNNNSTHRMYVLERDSPNPMGSYIFKGQLAPTTDRWAIDGTVLPWNDKLYFIWSGWPGSVDGQQNLYIAEMSNPWTISGERTLLATPTYSWERHGLPINEGPQILIHNGNLHIIYSASGYWRNEYALGRLTYNGTGPITSASSWLKASQPVFKQSGDIVGVGHASFTKSPDGVESWIVYHAHHDPVVWQDDRDILIQRFTYNASGVPIFGSPIPTSTKIEAPSGDPDANRTVVAGDADANGSVGRSDLDVFAGQFGLEMFPGAAADISADGIVDGTDFLAWQRRLGAAMTITAATPNDAAAFRAPSAASAAEKANDESGAAEGEARATWWIDQNVKSDERFATRGVEPKRHRPAIVATNHDNRLMQPSAVSSWATAATTISARKLREISAATRLAENPAFAVLDEAFAAVD